ncbi:hypothetical protein MMC34_001690 [Xylographa carneopallida]|nr:hypothetical protein [Xylographa carneopallida]
MSAPPSAARNASPLVRSGSEAAYDNNHVPSTPSTLSPAITPSSSASASRTKAPPPPSAVGVWRAERPQLSERDSIFATHYLVLDSDSAATTPRLPPTLPSKSNLPNLPQDVVSTLDLSAPLSPQATAPALLSRQKRQPSTMTRSLSHRSPYDSQEDYDQSEYQDSHQITFSDSGRFNETAVSLSTTVPTTGSELPAQAQDPSLLSQKTLVRPPHQPKVVRMSATWHQPEATSNNGLFASAERPDSREEVKSKDKSKRATSKARIDEQIEATLANEEPLLNARSRKASHYLGLFKENATSQEQRNNKNRSKDPSKSSQTVHVLESPKNEGTSSDGLRQRETLNTLPGSTSEAAENVSGLEKYIVGRVSNESGTRLRQSREPSGCVYSAQPLSTILNQTRPEYQESAAKSTGPADSIEWISGDQSQGVLPLRLLEEIRNQQRLPHGLKGDTISFIGKTARKEGDTHAQVLPTANLEPSVPDVLGRQGQSTQNKIDNTGDEDEYESDKEQISSATYYPHHAPSPDMLEDTDAEHSSPFESSDDATKSSEASSLDLADDEEDETIVKNVLEDLQHKGDGYQYHDKPMKGRSSSAAHLGAAPSSTTSSSSETEYDSWDESGISEKADDSGATDGGDQTPTATPIVHTHFLRSGSRQAPLKAVQLKPYKHQVGGHTNVYSFSKQAICKQLNNRENEFYEVIEHRHPELLKYLPRYAAFLILKFSSRSREVHKIYGPHPKCCRETDVLTISSNFLCRYLGVLNVTYRKEPRVKKRKKDTEGDEIQKPLRSSQVHSNKDQGVQAITENTTLPGSPNGLRIISHSQQKEPNDEIPEVLYANNLHIIPNNLFRTNYSDTRPKDRVSTIIDQPDDKPPDSLPLGITTNNSVRSIEPERSLRRPSIKQQHHPSWGATTVNTELKEQVLREVFSQPSIHHHSRRSGRSLHNSRPLTLFKKSQISSANGGMNGEDHEESDARADSTLADTTSKLENQNLSIESVPLTGSSAPDEHFIEPPLSKLEKVYTTGSESAKSSSSEVKQVRRRRSASGLRRKQIDLNVAQRTAFEYYDDEDYAGDKEDEIFPMDIAEPSLQPFEARDGNGSVDNNNHQDIEPSSSLQDGLLDRTPLVKTTPPTEPTPTPQQPTNPLQAQLQSTERVRHFLLLEDLTASMLNPCVLDLKMGTRQYGIEASKKKVLSQQQKCKTTTSQRLGVRLCGMQVWNVRKQAYLFEDKYAGRDITEGRAFKDALTRFLYDGVSYVSVARHIPILLERIAKLEKIISKLPGYRFYASSLLLLYDGAPATAEESGGGPVPDPAVPLPKPPPDASSSTTTTTTTTTPTTLPPPSRPSSLPKSNITIKLVDFANCVTAEDTLPPGTPCPPHDPAGVDRGYLRGLRTLRQYLQGIWRDVNDEDWVERGEGEGMALKRGEGFGIGGGVGQGMGVGVGGRWEEEGGWVSF